MFLVSVRLMLHKHLHHKAGTVIHWFRKWSHGASEMWARSSASVTGGNNASHNTRHQTKKPQRSFSLVLRASHPKDDQSAVFLNAGFLTSTVLEGMRQIMLKWWERGRARLRDCVSACVCVRERWGTQRLCSLFLFVFFFFFFPTLTLGLQIGQLHYQSAGPQIFKTNWIAHPIPITIMPGTITKLAIQHNNWKCGLPGPAGLPGGPADLWRHVKPANSTANYWCTAEWSCLSPKYHFQFTVRNRGPCWDRQKQQRSKTQECGHASFFCFLLSSRSFVAHLSACLCLSVSFYFPTMNIRECIKAWWSCNAGKAIRRWTQQQYLRVNQVKQNKKSHLAVRCLPTYCKAFILEVCGLKQPRALYLQYLTHFVMFSYYLLSISLGTPGYFLLLKFFYPFLCTGLQHC